MANSETKAPAELLTTVQSVQQNDERPFEGDNSRDNSTTRARMREQQACRDEFARLFGKDAEMTSRGGVTWLE